MHDAGSSHSWSRPGRGAAREPSVAPAVLSMQPVTPPRLKKRKTEHPHPMHNRIWYINIYTVGIEAALGNATPHTREALLDHIRRECTDIDVHAYLECFNFCRRGAGPLKCWGENINTLRACTSGEPFRKFLQGARCKVETHFANQPNVPMNILCVCGQGRHRSPAGARALADILSEKGYTAHEPIHLRHSARIALFVHRVPWPSLHIRAEHGYCANG